MKIFVYDASLLGLFCAFYKAFQNNIDNGIFLTTDESSEELFIENKVYVETIEDNADALINSLKTISHSLIHIVILCHLSELPGVENTLYQVIFQSLKKQCSILNWLGNDNVRRVNEVARKVSKEIHRFKGILRFSQLPDGSYIAKISPDYNIIIPLAKYFKERLKSEKWIILDEKRLTAVAYEGD
ncbi:MAG TPA: TIGR03915 family putative DNA repair protein, partial [Victivallales bacterium]|nr:TIGR03915 family putative DNA repair protein [Victivallales bacterium]